MAHQARKRFGQNFLHDRGVIGRILRAFGPRPGQHVVEIGPGRGALTYDLLEALGEMDAVELDRDLIARLEEGAAAHGTLRLHSADALTFDFCALAGEGERLRMIGNLPYNISTPLIFHLLDQARCIEDMCFMLQKEVVDRLAARPGSKDYGRLSVMVQWRCRVQRLLTVGPGAFSPPPKVDSAVVSLTPYETPPAAVDDPQLLGRIVQAAFGQRRKTLRNTLRGLLDEAQIASAGIDPGLRAEQLDIEQFARLANAALHGPAAD
jgi:16S rRNA (adenine1518-N6/adenine1519-N6)-dimethyltransferase